VELELVDAEQSGSGEQVDRVLIAERTHERGVLDERAEVLPACGHRVVNRREKVRLADAESAVEVDARLHLGLGGLLLPAKREQSATRDRLGSLRCEALQEFLRILLRRE